MSSEGWLSIMYVTFHAFTSLVPFIVTADILRMHDYINLYKLLCYGKGKSRGYFNLEGVVFFNIVRSSTQIRRSSTKAKNALL